MLICACELVEQRSLAAILVAGEREGDRRALGQGLTEVADVVVARRAHLANAGVRGRAGQRLDGNGRLGKGFHRLDQGEAGVIEAQRQLVAAQLNLDGVAHRGNLAHAHPDAGRKPHVEQMAAQLAVAAHRLDDRALPRLQRVERWPVIWLMLATCGFVICGCTARAPAFSRRAIFQEHSPASQLGLRRIVFFLRHANLVPHANFQLPIVARNGRERKNIFPNGREISMPYELPSGKPLMPSEKLLAPRTIERKAPRACGAAPSARCARC